jgi:hypothetical protein
MSKIEANREFKKHKEIYSFIDLGNDYIFRTYKQNFLYIDDKLSGVILSVKGRALGMDYDETVNYLNYIRETLENNGYETFLECEWWNAPLNYSTSGSNYGLLLNKTDHTKIVQLYSIRYELGKTYMYQIILKIWNYQEYIKLYNKSKQYNDDKIKKTGI